MLTTTGPVPQPHYPGAAADEPGREPGRQQPSLQGRGGRGRRGRLAGHVILYSFFYWTRHLLSRDEEGEDDGDDSQVTWPFYAFFIRRRGRLAGHVTFLRFFIGRRGRLAGHVTFLRFLLDDGDDSQVGEEEVTWPFTRLLLDETPPLQGRGRRGRLAGHVTFLRFFLLDDGDDSQVTWPFYAFFIGRRGRYWTTGTTRRCVRRSRDLFTLLLTTGTTRRSRDLFTFFYWTTGTTRRSRDLFLHFFYWTRQSTG